MVASDPQGGKSAALAEGTVKADGVHHCPKEHFSSLKALMTQGQAFEQSPRPSRNRKLPSSWKLLEVSSLPNPSVILGSPCRAPALKRHTFQAALEVKNPPAKARDMGDAGLAPGSGRSPGGGHATHASVLLPGEAHGQRSLAGYGPWGHTESDTTEQLSTHVFVPETFPPRDGNT